MFVKILLLLPLLAQGEINTIEVYNNNACSVGVFDYTGLTCVDCGELCSCPSSSLQTHIDCSIESMREGTCQEVVCSECPTSKVVSSDQSQCVLCSDDAAWSYDKPIFEVNSKQCSCKNPAKTIPTGTHVVSKRLVEIYDTDSGLPIGYDCLRCPDGTAVISSDFEDGKHFFTTAGAKYKADPSACVSCPDERMYFDTDYNCKCREGFTLVGEASFGHQSCIERFPTISSGYQNAYFRSPVASNDGESGSDFTLNSIVHSHYYLKSASQCEYFQGVSGESLQACQLLGNLCVLNMYDEHSVACKQYSTIAQRRLGTYHGQEEWKVTMPWLYYSGDASDVVNDRGLKMKMAFNDEHGNLSTSLTFKLAKYNIDGAFAGIEDLTNQLQYCSNDNINAEWRRFGQAFRIEYSCNVDNLLDQDMFVYDMYIVDDTCKGDTDDFECLYPVPVLNRNFVSDGAFPNMNLSTLDEEDDRYTRRLFFFDNQVSADLHFTLCFMFKQTSNEFDHLQSGRTSSGIEAIRYATSIMLLIQVKSDDPSKLTPPRLIIEYETKAIDPAREERQPISDRLLFKVDYSMKTDTFWESIQILIGFVAALALVVYGVKMNNWQTRQLQQGFGIQNESSLTSMGFVLHAMMILCHTFVLLFFPFAVAICSYW